MVLAMALFNGMDVVSKMLAADHPVVQVAWSRYLFHTLFLLPLLLPRRRGARPLLAAVQPWLQLVRGLGMFGSTVFFILALGRMPIAEAAAIGFISPLFVTALSVPLLGERVEAWRWSALLVGFAGVLVVMRPGSGAFDSAAIYPVLSSVCWALALIASRRIHTADPPSTTLAWTALVGLILASLAVPFFWVTPDLGGWLTMAVMGALSALAQYALIRAFVLGSASLLAPFAYSQMIWATLFGFLAFGAIPDLWTWVGAGIIVASGLYIGNRERR